jgi:hypothetical protein
MESRLDFYLLARQALLLVSATFDGKNDACPPPYRGAHKHDYVSSTND